MIVRSLPARFGDCLLVTWGSPKRAMLIDAGLGKTYTESLRPALAQCRSLGIRRLELVVVTHIDRDHIGGIEQTLKLQHDHGLPVAEVWFNGEPHLPRAPARPRGVEQGETIGRLLRAQSIPWNTSLAGKAIRIPGSRAVAECHSARGASPHRPGARPGATEATGRSMAEAVRSAEAVEPLPRGPVSPRRPPPVAPIDIDRLAAEPFSEDDSVANGSSIVLLLEQGRKAAVLTGDAYPSLVLAGWKRLVASRGSATKVGSAEAVASWQQHQHLARTVAHTETAEGAGVLGRQRLWSSACADACLGGPRAQGCGTAVQLRQRVLAAVGADRGTTAIRLQGPGRRSRRHRGLALSNWRRPHAVGVIAVVALGPWRTSGLPDPISGFTQADGQFHFHLRARPRMASGCKPRTKPAAKRRPCLKTKRFA